MVRFPGLVVAGLVCVGTLTGCVSTRSSPSNPVRARDAVGPVALPSIGQPTRITLATLPLPSHQEVEKSLQGNKEVTGYRLLVESQCQCLAAAESTLGNLLSSERDSVLAGTVGRYDRHTNARSVLAEVLSLRSVDERNRSAGAAMEAYYRLAGAYFGRDQIDRSLEDVRRSIQDYRKAKETGLSIPGDEAKLLAQEAELADRRVQVEGAIREADSRLCQLLGLEHDPSQPLWPGAEMTVALAPIDVEAAVAEGLRMRPDLAELIVLRDNLHEQTLGAVRSALARLDPLMGSSGPQKHMTCLGSNRARICLETQARQSQLDQLWQIQVRAAEDDIRRAVGEVEMRLRRVGLAKDKLDQVQTLLRRLRERREAKGAVQVSEISTAQSDVFRAESDAFQAVVEWKIAMVKLRQSQGLLAAECGYALTDPGQSTAEDSP